MNKDLNKGITDIQYNSLNLPRLLDIKSPVAEGRNEYTYTASGVKLKSVQKWNPNFFTAPVIGSGINTTSLTQAKTTDYIGNIIYENNALKRILVDGGYYEGGVYYYYLADHLGNNRVVVNQSGTVTQKNHYYPFGTAFADKYDNGTNQPYKYNGKELDGMHQLNLYDYSARYYESAIGRFTSVDPLAEKYYSWSPYMYCVNNPMRFIDPNGTDTKDIVIEGANESSVTLATNLIDISVDASSLGIDFGGNYTIQGEDVLSAGLDIVGIIDPTGVADGLNAGLQAKNGDWVGAGISALGVIPYIGDAAKIGKVGKDVKIIEKAIEAVKNGDNAKALLKQGRAGKQEKLRELATDPKLGKADKGWLKQEINAVDKGKRTSLRNPPGKDLAHKRGKEAAKGYSYKYTDLKNKSDHTLQHKYDRNGKLNKEIPE